MNRHILFRPGLGLILLFSFATMAAEAPLADTRPARPQRRLLVNNDGTNLLWRNDLTPEMVRRHVAECPNAVTTYLLCPNGIQRMLFPSAHEELATRGALPKLVAAGQDPFGEFLSGLKARGFEAFITWRMNEVHNVNIPEEPDLSRFWREHPDYRVERGANRDNWMAQCLDYSLAPVREYNLTLIFELMEKYEPNGIELDWMRFPRHLGGQGDEIWNQRHHLTEVVARVKAKADELGQRLRRPLLVAVRVPTSPAGCRALGVDIAEWNRRGLIDFVTASPFLASDFSMPLTALRHVLGERPVPLYAAIEIGYAGKPHREETMRAAALGLWESGADGLYLFNFPCWREEQPHPFWSWVPPLGNPELLRGRALAFPLINQHHRIAGIDLPSPLPVTVPAGETRTVVLSLPSAAVENSPRAARLTLEGATNVSSQLNGVAIRADTSLPPPAIRPGYNQLALVNTSAQPVTVTLAELALDYVLAPPQARTYAGTTFYVATNGSDLNPGTEAQAFRTLARARDAARSFRGSKALSGEPISIVLRGGTYRLKEPFGLDARDNHTVFRAFPSETPVVSGGRRVTGWQLVDKGRWQTTVALEGFRQLYVNGRRAVRARGVCPRGMARYGNPNGIDAEAGFVFPDGALADWRNPGDLELGFFNSWSHMICRVERITRDAQGRAMVKMRQPAFFLASRKEGVQAKLPDYLENALELLDAPGEWYYDRPARSLYYQPREGEDLTTADVIVPQLESLVRIEGTLDQPVCGISFEGIVFAEATWLQPSYTGHLDVQANFTTDAANLFSRDGWVVKQHNEYLKSPAHIVLHSAQGCRFERCTFTRLGGAGLDIEHGSRDNRVNGCHFFDISGSAIQLGDVLAKDHHPDDPRLIVRDNRVTNCRLHELGVEFEDSVGIFAGYTDGAVIAHNEIYDLPYSGLSVGWGWGEEDAGGGAYVVIPFRYSTPTPAGANRIERNHIHHVMRRRDDGGAIYMLGNQPGSVISENHLHDCGPGGPGGIYLDEGSGFIEITRNCVYHVATPMNYNNRAQDRITTCFEHDNYFGPAPGETGFPDSVARRAGPESDNRAWVVMASIEPAQAANFRTEANMMVEIPLQASRTHADPFNEMTVDLVITDPAGQQSRVPAFWAGGNGWKVRYASPLTGLHRYRSECNDVSDQGLHGLQGSLEITPYTGANRLYLRGPLRVAADRRHLEHADGTPFFWLGDTWWMGLCHRLEWPAEFKILTADRCAKGFTVIQIVAGLYPDMPAFDPRGANEAGFPWETNYARIRPQYFDAADRRLAHLVESGVTPCLVGAWGYFLPWMGVEKAKQHWRYLIARYGAWPMVWCIAGEANLPYYLAKGFPYDDREQVKGWTEVTRYVRETDPFHRLITIHPTGIGRLSARNATADLSLLDIDMLQTPHGQREAVPPTLRTVRESYADRPVLPVINGEASYEMLNDKIPAEWPRAMFWICLMNGAAGHTYGANGIWQCNRQGQPHGASPHGGNYGQIPWDEAMNLPGSQQLAFGKQLLERYPWSRFTPHPEWVAWASDRGEAEGPQAAGIPEAVRVVWVPRSAPIFVRNLGAGAVWAAGHFDPVSGARGELGEIRADDTGQRRFEPPAGLDHDWVQILEARR